MDDDVWTITITTDIVEIVFRGIRLTIEALTASEIDQNLQEVTFSAHSSSLVEDAAVRLIICFS